MTTAPFLIDMPQPCGFTCIGSLDELPWVLLGPNEDAWALFPPFPSQGPAAPGAPGLGPRTFPIRAVGSGQQTPSCVPTWGVLHFEGVSIAHRSASQVFPDLFSPF